MGISIVLVFRDSLDGAARSRRGWAEPGGGSGHQRRPLLDVNQVRPAALTGGHQLQLQLPDERCPLLHPSAHQIFTPSVHQ